ncbi:hypothetical protein Tco_0629681 [Tanacetum coccineum]|uniref:Uncharacterized protein n=1 Tax=Tanacetum coccineum TaxID=301880 RepID=A0ABQ4WTV3_9ASTR
MANLDNKEVEDKVYQSLTTSRSYDNRMMTSQTDDDDEGPSAGSNQGRSTKRRRSDSAASGSAQPPPKDDDQSSKKPRESDASASKQHPALTSTGWQITDTRDAGVDSSMHRSDPESEHSEQSSDDIPMQDEGNDSDMEDTDNAHIPKVSTTTWFKPIPESERPATPEPEWTIPPNDFPEPEINWANTYATTYQVPAENKLQRKTYDIGSFIKWFCCRGPPGHGKYSTKFFFNKDLDYLLNCAKSENPYPLSKLKAARAYLDFRLEELVPSLCGLKVELLYMTSVRSSFPYSIFKKASTIPQEDKASLSQAVNKMDKKLVISQYYFKEEYTIIHKPRSVVYRVELIKRKMMRLNELHKFSNGTLNKESWKSWTKCLKISSVEYIRAWRLRKWSEDDK